MGGERGQGESLQEQTIHRQAGEVDFEVGHGTLKWGDEEWDMQRKCRNEGAQLQVFWRREKGFFSCFFIFFIKVAQFNRTVFL